MPTSMMVQEELMMFVILSHDKKVLIGKTHHNEANQQDEIYTVAQPEFNAR